MKYKSKKPRIRMFQLGLILLLGLLSARQGEAAVKVGDKAPGFVTKTQTGSAFDLSSRLGKWTVLYFYPKADTPGCTKQACAFRDSIKGLREMGADVYGVSSDDVESLAKFHSKHHLSFDLLADPKGEIISAYGAKMPVLTVAKRWTFVLDTKLQIRHIDQNVDPVKDPENMMKVISDLKKAEN